MIHQNSKLIRLSAISHTRTTLPYALMISQAHVLEEEGSSEEV